MFQPRGRLPESWLAAFTLLRPLLPVIEDMDHPGGLTALRTLDATWVEHWRASQLTPLLYRQLARRGWEARIAPPWWSTLRDDYVLALQSALQEEEEIKELLRALTKEGVTPILLKGADLRLRVYGDPAVRPMADLDILVAPSQVERALGVLESMEFRLQAQCLDPLPGWRARFRNELHFAPPPGWPLLIDLHWQLDNICRFYHLPYTRLQEKAIPSEYQGYPVKLLCPEHLVIHLALHTYAEPDSVLKIIDLERALSLPLDWPFFLEELARFNCQMPLYIILLGISRLFPPKVPPFILDRLGQSRPSWVEKLVLRESLGYLTIHAATLYHHRRLSDWFFYLRALIWPQEEYLTAIYGRPDRNVFFHQILAHLFSYAKNWMPH
jgi:hypothetical protein